MYQWRRDTEPFTSGNSATIFTCSSPAYNENRVMVMKVFKKGKANSTFIKEVDLHRSAAEIGVAPRLIDFYIGGTVRGMGDQSYIVMDKLDITVIDIIQTNRELSDEQWNEIISLYRKLDAISVLHNDSNPMNLMMSRSTRRFYLIDFGMSKRSKGNMNISYPLMRARLLREEKRYTQPPTTETR